MSHSITGPGERAMWQSVWSSTRTLEWHFKPQESVSTSSHSRPLAHKDLNKMATILQMTFSMYFLQWNLSWFVWNCSVPGGCTIGSEWVSVGSCNGLAPSRRQAITWTNDDLVHWFNELMLIEWYHDGHSWWRAFTQPCDVTLSRPWLPSV